MLRNATLAALAVTAFAGTLVAQGATSSTDSIVYVQGDRDGQNLFRTTVPGGETTQLTELAKRTRVGDLAWSPDGSKIAFTANKSLANEIHVLDLATRKSAVLVKDDASQPSWSPDSKQVVYCAGGMNRRDLWIIGASGGKPRALTTQEAMRADKFQPRWSPDGRTIAFLVKEATAVDGGGHTYGLTDVYAIQSDGSRMRNLTQSPGNEADATWTADGKTLIYAHQPVKSRNKNMIELGGFAIWAMDLDGKPRMLSKADDADSMPEIAAGSRLVFSSMRDGGWAGIYTMAIDGGEASRISPEEYKKHLRPRANASGTHVAYAAVERSKMSLMVVPIDGGSATTIAGGTHDFVWAPAHAFASPRPAK